MLVTVSCPPREGDEEQEGDVGLQLTIKFPERAVIRNYRLNGKWGTEESNLSFFPFAAGESFKVRFWDIQVKLHLVSVLILTIWAMVKEEFK